MGNLISDNNRSHITVEGLVEVSKCRNGTEKVIKISFPTMQETDGIR